MKNMKILVVSLLLLAVLCVSVTPACADDVIVLPDPVLEEAVRAQIGKPEGDITIADVENVVALDLGYFEGEQITDLHGLELFPALDGVCFSRQAVSDLSPLAMSESLNFIEIGDAGLTDLSSLAGTGVTEILLYGNRISDLTPLKDMTQLEVLVLEGNNIRDVSPLKGLTNLRVLILGDNPIADFTPLAGIYDQLEDKDFELTDSATVQFADSALEDAVRGMIGKKEGELTAADVADITCLDFYELDNKVITDLGGLEYFTSLEEIHLTGSAVCDLGPLAGLENLRTVEIGDAQIGDAEALRGMNLKEVLLYGNLISDVSPFAEMEGLEVLVLAGNCISDVSALAGLDTLRVLILCDNLIGDFTPLAGIFDQLEEKDFELTKAEAIAFADPVLERKVREILGKPEGEITTADAMMVDELYLNSEGGDRIADLSGLEYFTNLSNLQANDNDIADISVLAGLTNLWNLELGGNRISDISALAGLNIENLSLWENQITDISPLEDMYSLSILDLCNNQVSDISALEGKTNLWILALGGNPVTDFSPVAEFYDGIEEKDFVLDARTQMVLEGKDPDVIVTFDDPVLEQRIREVIGIPEGDITAADAAGVTELNLGLDPGDGTIPLITYLNGLQYFENLVSLDLSWALDAGMAQVDLMPIATLTKLERLMLYGNKIQDISQLSELTNLWELEIYGNEISDISALANMTQMECLGISANQISDIGVVAICRISGAYIWPKTR